jgi:ABC-type Mn2+/Zn2+ transport system permease subunit
VLDFLLGPMSYGFMQRGLVAAILVGIVCAVMGAFVVLRGLAFIGDAVSHAAFRDWSSRSSWDPVVHRRAIAAVGTALAIGVVARRGALRFDTAVGVLFAGMFAFGIVLFSTIQGYVTDLFSYLLGNVLGSRHRTSSRSPRSGASSCWWSRSCARSCCTPRSIRGAAASGLPVVTLDYLLLRLIGVTIVVSIQAVGIIMVVAMLVARRRPASCSSTSSGTWSGSPSRSRSSRPSAGYI